MAGTGGIPEAVKQSLVLFDQVSTLLTTYHASTRLSIKSKIDDERTRFRVWSGNISAHQTGTRSLQYRLRDASNLQKQVLSLLDDLIATLSDAADIINQVKLPWDQLQSEDSEAPVKHDGSYSDEDVAHDMPTTELEQIADEAKDVVSCLMRLSVALRNPAPHNRFRNAQINSTAHYSPWDIDHVRSKFSGVSDLLAERLGRAITSRRQYFKYRKSHHMKLAQGLGDDDILDGKGKAAESTIASSLPDNLKQSIVASRFQTVDEDAMSNTGVSQTSFASSRLATSRLRLPPLPREAEDGPFECPYCYALIIASTERAWRRHVFGDLRPYICMFEDCETPNEDFARRHEWAAHELERHWKTYYCPLNCDVAFSSAKASYEHLKQTHGETLRTVSSQQINALIDLGARPQDWLGSVACPLCSQALTSSKEYRRHVGRHQEQLALFALPDIFNPDQEDLECREDSNSLAEISEGAGSESLSDESNTHRRRSIAATFDGIQLALFDHWNNSHGNPTWLSINKNGPHGEGHQAPPHETKVVSQDIPVHRPITSPRLIENDEFSFITSSDVPDRADDFCSPLADPDHYLRQEALAGPYPDLCSEHGSQKAEMLASYVPPLATENASSITPPAPGPDPEREKIKAQLEALQAEKERTTLMQRRAAIEVKIRLDAEENFRQQMEAVRIAAEEHKKELELARIEAERIARERLEAERQADEERQKQYAEAMKRGEENTCAMIEAEIKAAKEARKIENNARAKAEELARIRYEAAMKKEAEARAEAEKRAAEEVERLKRIQEDAKMEAEAEFAKMGS